MFSVRVAVALVLPTRVGQNHPASLLRFKVKASQSVEGDEEKFASVILCHVVSYTGGGQRHRKEDP